jgi:hypothetical protein
LKQLTNTLPLKPLCFCANVPSISFAIVFPAGASPEKANMLLEGLGEFFPRDKVEQLIVAQTPTEGNIQFKVDRSAYQRATVERLIRECKKCDGELVELWRLPKERRDAFRAQHSNSADEAVKNYADAAARVAKHLKGIKSVKRPVAAAAASAADDDAGKRQWERFEVKLTVQFKTALEFVTEHATNICNGGIFVETALKPELNSIVELRVQLPNGTWHQTRARVAHLKPTPNGVGLNFAGEDTAFQAALDSYLVSLAEE